jgi:hypothetical protein
VGQFSVAGVGQFYIAVNTAANAAAVRNGKTSCSSLQILDYPRPSFADNIIYAIPISASGGSGYAQDCRRPLPTFHCPRLSRWIPLYF